jgi:hypothetical protein
MTPNFCKTYFNMQGVEILGMKTEQTKKENKPIAPIIVAKEY